METSSIVGISFVLLASAVTALIVYMKISTRDSVQKKVLLQAKSMESAGADKFYVSGDGCFALGVSTVDGKVFYSDRSLNTIHVESNKIISVEIVEDGKSLTRTGSSRSIGGALIGGVVAGPAGAVIGGLGGRTKGISEELVKKIGLKIIVNDTDMPVINVIFIDEYGDGISKETKKYKDGKKAVEYWHGLITVLVNRRDC